MSELIEKLELSQQEFEEYYLYGKSWEIPTIFTLKSSTAPTDKEHFFKSVIFNLFNLANLFINQKMSKLLNTDLTKSQILEIIGIERWDNFKAAIYTELRYRLINKNWPEYKTREQFSLSNWNVVGNAPDMTIFNELINSESRAFLASPDWSLIDLDALEFQSPSIVLFLENLIKDIEVLKISLAQNFSDDNLNKSNDETLRNKFQTLETTLRELKEETQNKSSELLGLQTSLTFVNNKYQTIEEKWIALSEKIETLENSIFGINENQASEQIYQIQEELHGIKQDITDLQNNSNNGTSGTNGITLNDVLNKIKIVPRWERVGNTIIFAPVEFNKKLKYPIEKVRENDLLLLSFTFKRQQQNLMFKAQVFHTNAFNTDYQSITLLPSENDNAFLGRENENPDGFQDNVDLWYFKISDGYISLKGSGYYGDNTGAITSIEVDVFRFKPGLAIK